MKRMLTVLTAGFLCFAPLAAQAQHGRSQSPAARPAAPSSPPRATPPHRPSTPEPARGTRPEPGRANSGTEHGRTTDEVLTQNTRLSSRLETLTGMESRAACQGFKNLGQCVAAANASHTLGLSFADLKTRMTGANRVSLGDAIHELNPTVDARAEGRRAERQAKADMRSSER